VTLCSADNTGTLFLDVACLNLVMAFRLQYRGTFIDVPDNASLSFGSRKRSGSLPPKFEESSEESTSQMNYLIALSQKAEQLRQSKIKEALSKQLAATLPAKDSNVNACEKSSSDLSMMKDGASTETDGSTTGSESPPAMGKVCTESTDCDSVETRPGLNPGSVGHPEVCRRPCIFFAAGNCSSGIDCGYCHCDHSTRPTHLDKRQREVIQKLSQAQLLQIILKHMRKRAESSNLEMHAAGILDLTEQRLVDAQRSECTTQESTVTSKMLERLNRFLAGVSIGGLVGIIIRNGSEHEIERMTNALAQLRDSMGAAQA